MTLAEFRETLGDQRPPSGLSGPIAALWFDANGDWDGAHGQVQDDASAEAAWVHAYLHRREGDLPNAEHWYRRAGRPADSGSLTAEWEQIARHLLSETI